MILRLVIALLACAAASLSFAEDPTALNDPFAQLVVELRVGSETNFLGTAAAPAGRDLSIRPATTSAAASSMTNDPLEKILRSRETDVIAQLEAHLKEHPAEPRAWRALGDQHFRRKDFPKAESAYQHAYDLAPADPDTLNNLAAALVMENRQDRAVELLRDALLRQPGNHAARFNLACIAAKRGHSDEALKHLQLLEAGQWDALRLHITDSDLDSLRDNPAFLALQKRMTASARVTENKP